MYKYNLFLTFLFLSHLACNQEFSVRDIDSIQGEVGFFSADNLGNIYLSNNDVILKLDKNKDTLFSTSLKSIIPSYIEASKNFRILIFDQARGVVQFLDNTLTDVSGELNLNELDLFQPALVCESFNGNSFWVLDAGLLKLVKVNDRFEIVSQIDNLNQYIETEEIPNRMMEYNDQLYLLIPNNKILIFDAFGTHLKTLPFNYSGFCVYNKYIIGYQNDEISLMMLPFLTVNNLIKLPYKIQALQVSREVFYIKNEEGIKSLKIGSK